MITEQYFFLNISTKPGVGDHSISSNPAPNLYLFNLLDPKPRMAEHEDRRTGQIGRTDDRLKYLCLHT